MMALQDARREVGAGPDRRTLLFGTCQASRRTRRLRKRPSVGRAEWHFFRQSARQAGNDGGARLCRLRYARSRCRLVASVPSANPGLAADGRARHRSGVGRLSTRTNIRSSSTPGGSSTSRALRFSCPSWAPDFASTVPSPCETGGGIWRLLVVVMPLSILGIAVAAYGLLGLTPAYALLVAAILAPTDPVLASEVGAGPPGSEDDSDTRFNLTGEAGVRPRPRLPLRAAWARNAGAGRI